MGATSGIIISDGLRQRNVVRLHPKTKHEKIYESLAKFFVLRGGVIIKNVFKI